MVYKASGCKGKVELLRFKEFSSSVLFTTVLFEICNAFLTVAEDVNKSAKNKKFYNESKI